MLPGHAIIRVQKVCICGTDIPAFEGTQPYFSYPRILNHELAGELVDFYGVPGFKKGETATIIPYLNCGKSIACKKGKPNCCVDVKVADAHSDGGLREYFSIPSYSLVHGDGLSLDELAMAEPLSIGGHAIWPAWLKPSEYGLVVGAGPIGLGLMEFARIAGGLSLPLTLTKIGCPFAKTS